MIDGVVNSDAIPVLERMIQFAGSRQRIIANNIANIDTPGFRPRDVSLKDFQAQLGEAIDESRETNGNSGGPLPLRDSQEVDFREHSLRLHPEPAGDNILFHDGNDRNLERMMQDMVENFFAFRTAAQFLRSRFDLIGRAIAERV